MKIGVFDSGIGGLTILKEIRKLLPRENILYYGDFKNMPYGQKTEKEILELSCEITEFMIRNHCKAIVVACSVFSAASINYLRDTYNIPIIGMIEPGIKAALLETENNKIGLIGNPFTVKNSAYRDTLSRLSNNTELYQVPCDSLCEMIENGWDNYPNNKDILKTYLDKLPEDIDTLILGGTHYPLIRHDIEGFFHKTIVNSSRESVIELLDAIITNNLINRDNSKGSIEFCIRGNREILDNAMGHILKKEKNCSIYNVF